MYEIVSLTGIDDESAADVIGPRHVELRRAVQGQAPLYDTFQTLTRYREAHAHTAADLFERETWALTVIINASEPIWADPASPTLRFAIPGPERPAPYHLELGRFGHLAALLVSSRDEQALIAARTPCWARVCPHQERQAAGQAGALACAYTPLSTADAVALLGFGRILSQIELRTRAAGKTLLVEAEEQDERQQRLVQVERMLGWAPDPIVAREGQGRPMHQRILVGLLGDGRGKRCAGGTAMLGAAMAALSFAIGIPLALLLLLIAASMLVIWNYMIAA